VALTSVLLGEVQVASLRDAEGFIGPLVERFPWVPEVAWTPYRVFYPSLFADGQWRLPFGCFLIHSRGATVLVDCGVGPASEFLPEAQGELPATLAATGTPPEAIDVVLLTHLHVDHIGWTVGASGEPTFPNADYLVHHDAWAWAQAPQRIATAPIVRSILPLRRNGRLRLLDSSEHELAPGVQVFPTPGHTSGHVSVRVDEGDRPLIILGDVAVHPAQLDRPGWIYDADEQPQLVERTRRELVHELESRRCLVACGHYPDGGIGRLKRSGEHLIWVPLRLGAERLSSLA
jgi:glyoxylase-like metal-dependent hydrolase (beta-lactamase superfamily II)